MANDKDFVVAGAVEVGKDTKVTLGTVTSNNIDLATGNYFADTPTGASTYTISNAGDVQSFQLEVTGGTEEVAQNFSTTLYTGNGSTQTITNGIDLSGDGGAVWFKKRSGNEDHNIYDTERGVLKRIKPNTTDAENSQSNGLTTFNSDGWTMGSSGNMNQSGDTYVSWTFKKEPSFFDVVTYTGDGTSNKVINHNLGSTPAVIITKRTDSISHWATYHHSVSDPTRTVLYLDKTDAAANFPSADTATITDSSFTIGTNQIIGNGNGATYVAYIFAHDDAADGLIQCGSYTGGGTGNGPIVTLGWEPQWILYKEASNTEAWGIVDNVRGMVSGGKSAILRPNDSAAESENPKFSPLSTGFEVTGNGYDVNRSGSTYIYIAIRAASDPDIAWPSSIEWAGGIAPSAPATGETDVYTLVTDDGGTSYVGVKTADNLS